MVRQSKRLWTIRILMFLLDTSYLLIPTCLSTFVVYVNALKAQLELSQTQVSIIASTVTISQLFLLISGIVYDKWGILPTCIIHLTLTTLGWSGLWLTLIAPHSNTISFHCLVVFFAIAGHGRSYFDILFTPFGISIMPKRYRSFVVLLLQSAFDSGYFFNALIYEKLIAKDKGIDVQPLQQNLTTYVYGVFFVNVLMSFIVTTVFPLGQKYQIHEEASSDTTESLDKQTAMESSAKETKNVLSGSREEERNSIGKHGSKEVSSETRLDEQQSQNSKSVTLKQTLESVSEKQSLLTKITNQNDEQKVYNTSNKTPGDNISYQRNECMSKSNRDEKSKLYSDIITARYVFLALAIANGVTISTYSMTNVTLLTQSLGLSKYDYYLVTTQRLIVFGGKVVCTFMVMVLKKYTLSMQMICLQTAFLYVASQIIILFFGENGTAFLISHIVVCLCHGLYIILGINIITLSFSLQRFGVNYGLMATLMTAFAFASQMIFGSLYDAEIPKGGGIYCYGKHCIFKFYIYTTCQASFVVLMVLGLLFQEYKKQKCN